jgi:hypothetical protein
MKKFRIDADNLSWINGEKDDPEDLCLHGHAVVFIDNKRLEYDATVSATALYLLKSITENHIINEDLQMLPCCGHMIIPNDDLSEVSIVGCDNGVDWTVLHNDDCIKLIFDDGAEACVSLEEYKKAVFSFADKIEKFYNECSPKNLTNDEFEKEGYIAFWNEWHRRRNEE